MSTPSLYTLPIELLQRIIDYVDAETIFFSFRNVCKHFYTIINSYNQYKLDFRSTTIPALHRMRHFIQPENVISLIISNKHQTFGQINLFLSLFDIHTFTRLRSLSLIQVDNPDLITFLKHVSTCSLVSLSIDYRRPWISTTTSETIQMFMHCPIRHLTLTQWRSFEDISDIFLYCPDLETFMLDGLLLSHSNDDFTTSVKIKSKLKSLTLDFYSSSINMIIWILSCTPSLIHLRLMGQPAMSGIAWDGYGWTEVIQKNLTQLQFFQFFFENRIEYKQSTCDIESIMASFRTSFWMEKRWYVTCDYYNDTQELKLYSIPICKPTILYKPTPNKISCSNLTNNTLYIMDNVSSLILNLIPATADMCDKNLLPNRPLFLRITKLTLLITNDFSNGSIDYLSNLIDFSHLDTLSLRLDLCEQSFKNICTQINTLFDRSYNVQSIDLRSIRSKNLVNFLEIIYSTIPNQVKHLLFEIEDGYEMQWIFDRFENFSSITLQLRMNSAIIFDPIIEKFKKQGSDFTYHKYMTHTSVWFSRQKLNN